MSKPLVAHQRMKEFDPECERHLPLLLVKVVDPGCTLELQIEDCRTGKVTRLTTTDSAAADMLTFKNAVQSALETAWTAAKKEKRS